MYMQVQVDGASMRSTRRLVADAAEARPEPELRREPVEGLGYDNFPLSHAAGSRLVCRVSPRAHVEPGEIWGMEDKYSQQKATAGDPQTTKYSLERLERSRLFRLM